MSYVFRSFQWFIFLLANGLGLPIVLGQLYHLSPVEIAELLGRTILVIALSTFLQVIFGHRLPLIDGPAGIWLGVFVVMGQIAATKSTLTSLEGMLITAAIVLVIFGVTGWLGKMLSIFTSLVTSTFLVLLSLQLSGVFLKGMLGIRTEITYFSLKQAAIAIFIFFLVFALSIWGKGWMKTYTVLIGIILGWFGFLLIGAPSTKVISNSFFALPKGFAFGWPHFDLGVVISGVCIALVLMSNTVASVEAVNQVVPVSDRADRQSLNRSSWISGVTHAISALFSTIGMVSLTVSAGFVKITNQTKTGPLKIACVALVVITCFPTVTSFLATLPSQVAYAAILPSFAQMFAIGIRTLFHEPLDDRRVMIFSLSVVVGVGIMFLPQAVFQKFPALVQYLLGNGLLVGVAIVILLDQLWKHKSEYPFG